LIELKEAHHFERNEKSGLPRSQVWQDFYLPVELTG